MSVSSLKTLHISCVMLSYALFMLRGIWVLSGSVRLEMHWLRWLPHVVDSMLLGSAVAMLYQLGISPGSTPWLQAKLSALLVYIALGSIALKRGKTRHIRLTAWIAAQGVFIYIVSVALTRNPWPWQGVF